MNLKLIAVSVMALVLSACGETGNFPPADGGNGGNGSITVRTSDGGTVVLQGTYSSDCYQDGFGNYIRDSHVINGNSIIIRFTTYTAAGCSVESNSSDIITTTMSVGSDGTGPWVDGMDVATQAPTTADGQSFLPDLPAFTRINLSIGGVLYYVVDTTGTMPVLYRNNDNVLNAVSTADPLTLQ